MRFLKTLITGKKTEAEDSFSVGLARIGRIQSATVTGSVLFKAAPKRRAA